MSLFLLRKQAPGFRKAVPDLALCRRYVTQNFLQTWWRPFLFFNKEKSAKVVIETQQLAWKIIPWMFEHFFPFRTVISSFHCAEVRIKSSPPCTQAKKPIWQIYLIFTKITSFVSRWSLVFYFLRFFPEIQLSTGSGNPLVKGMVSHRMSSMFVRQKYRQTLDMTPPHTPHTGFLSTTFFRYIPALT